MATESEPLPLVAVKSRSVFCKIDRRLAKLGRQLRRGSHEHGRYYVVDVATGEVVESHVDLEELGKRLGALSRRQRLAD